MTDQERADRIFSVYVRVSNADHAGYAACFTCGKRSPWQEQQNGHFLRRALTSVRYHENNCRVQCEECNVAGAGKIDIYYEALIDDIGEDGVREIIELSKKRIPPNYKEIINKYRLLLKANYAIII